MIITRILQCSINEQMHKNPLKLYKYLLRECEKLPKEAQKFYRHSVQQSFKQHVSENDPERIRMIIDKTLQDAQWISHKYKTGSKT